MKFLENIKMYISFNREQKYLRWFLLFLLIDLINKGQANLNKNINKKKNLKSNLGRIIFLIYNYIIPI